MKIWTGGCLCGALRYEAAVSKSENWYCHCRMCQKATGSAVSTSAIIKKASYACLKARQSSINPPPEGHYGIESRISWLKIVDDLKQECTEHDASSQASPQDR